MPKKSRERSHERWTNAFSRQSIQWDEEAGLLVNERGKLHRKLKKKDMYPMDCCGNSPGKSHKKFCEILPPGSYPLYTSFKKTLDAPLEHVKPKLRKISQSATKRKRSKKTRRILAPVTMEN